MVRMWERVRETERLRDTNTWSWTTSAIQTVKFQFQFACKYINSFTIYLFLRRCASLIIGFTCVCVCVYLGISFYLSSCCFELPQLLHASFHWSILKQYIEFTRIILVTDVFQTERKRRREKQTNRHRVSFVPKDIHCKENGRISITRYKRRREKNTTQQHQTKSTHTWNKQTNERTKKKLNFLANSLKSLSLPRSTNLNTTYSIH